MNDHLKHVSSRYEKKNLNCGVLTYQWWDKQKLKIELEEKNKREIQQYELQKNHLISITNLSQNPNIHKFFTDLLQTNARKFTNSQNLNILITH